MFCLGEKVKLIASSCHKKTGPRKNSIGYITIFDSTLFISDLRGIVAIAADIRFLRYGNEKDCRFETKRVELVFPMLQSPDTTEKLQKFLHSVDKNVESLKKIRVMTGISEDIPIIMAIPDYTPEINFETCSNQEFSCWFESCIMAPQMNSFVNEALNSQHFFQNKDHEILIHKLLSIRNMALDKKTRRDILKAICRDRVQRKIWIHILRRIIITIKLIEQKKVINRLRGELDYMNTNSAYFVLSPYLFYLTFYIFKNMYVKHKKFGKVVAEIEATKTAILALSTKNLN